MFTPKDKEPQDIRLYKIYVISDGQTGYPRYVGRTISPIHTRLAEHLISKVPGVKNWYRRRLAKGFVPVISVLEVCEDLETANIREKYWIKQLGKKFDLLNRSSNPSYTQGGGGKYYLISNKELI